MHPPPPPPHPTHTDRADHPTPPPVGCCLQEFGSDARYLPPATSTYNALLRGLGSSLAPLPPQGSAAAAEAAEAEPPARGRGNLVTPEQLDAVIHSLRDEMTSSQGLRPGRWVAWGQRVPTNGNFT